MSGAVNRPAPLRWVFLGVGYASVGLAVAGTVLPLLPTTPFLLVAAWAFARANPRLRDWLDRHPRLGPFLRDWERDRAIPRGAKVSAVAGLSGSWGVIVLSFGDQPAVPAAAAVALLAVALYILTRPAPRADGSLPIDP